MSTGRVRAGFKVSRGSQRRPSPASIAGRSALAIALVVVGAQPSVSSASWFESCTIVGEVTAVGPAPAGDAHALDVVVIDASRSEHGAASGYTDCSGHGGTAMGVELKIPRRVGRPEVGDQVTFLRAAFDGFTEDGSFAGTSVSVEFRELRKAPPDDE